MRFFFSFFNGHCFAKRNVDAPLAFQGAKSFEKAAIAPEVGFQCDWQNFDTRALSEFGAERVKIFGDKTFLPRAFGK